jgi:berberine-like enzyme
MWMDPDENDRTRGFAEAILPFGTGKAAFPNFIGYDEGSLRLRESYGEEKYARLVELKAKWDPANLFRLNQNILPGP